MVVTSRSWTRNLRDCLTLFSAPQIGFIDWKERLSYRFIGHKGRLSRCQKLLRYRHAAPEAHKGRLLTSSRVSFKDESTTSLVLFSKSPTIALCRFFCDLELFFSVAGPVAAVSGESFSRARRGSLISSTDLRICKYQNGDKVHCIQCAHIVPLHKAVLKVPLPCSPSQGEIFLFQWLQ